MITDRIKQEPILSQDEWVKLRHKYAKTEKEMYSIEIYNANKDKDDFELVKELWVFNTYEDYVDSKASIRVYEYNG